MNEINALLDAVPWLKPVVLWLGIARLLLKPFSVWLNKLMWAACDYARGKEKEYHWLDWFLNWWPWRVFAFVVDYTCSVKLPTDLPEENTTTKTP